MRWPRPVDDQHIPVGDPGQPRRRRVYPNLVFVREGMQDGFDADARGEHGHDECAGARADVSSDLKRIIFGTGKRKRIGWSRVFGLDTNEGEAFISERKTNADMKRRRLGRAPTTNETRLGERQLRFKFSFCS